MFKILVALVVAFAFGVGVSLGVAVSQPSSDTLILRPCVTEDSNNCYWNAAQHGTGMGASFITLDDHVYYTH